MGGFIFKFAENNINNLVLVYVLAEELEIDAYKLRKLLKENGIKIYRIYKQGKRGYLNGVIPEDAERFKTIFYEAEAEAERKAKDQEKKKKELIFPPNLAELQKAHPLVTDPRCFILSWFPDVDIF